MAIDKIGSGLNSEFINLLPDNKLKPRDKARIRLITGLTGGISMLATQVIATTAILVTGISLAALGVVTLGGGFAVATIFAPLVAAAGISVLASAIAFFAARHFLKKSRLEVNSKDYVIGQISDPSSNAKDCVTQFKDIHKNPLQCHCLEMALKKDRDDFVKMILDEMGTLSIEKNLFESIAMSMIKDQKNPEFLEKFLRINPKWSQICMQSNGKTTTLVNYALNLVTNSERDTNKDLELIKVLVGFTWRPNLMKHSNLKESVREHYYNELEQQGKHAIAEYLRTIILPQEK